MIDPFKISLDIRDRGWVSEAEPHPHKFDEFNGAPFGSLRQAQRTAAQGTPFQWIIFYMDYPNLSPMVFTRFSIDSSRRQSFAWSTTTFAIISCCLGFS
jgi:hypothetical protein